MSHIVYSDTSVTSADGAITIGQHTDAIYITNLDNSTNAIVRLNGGPHEVLVPHKGHLDGYIKIPGDYTRFQVITSGITLAIYAVG